MLIRSLAYEAAQQDPSALSLAAIVLQTSRGVRVWSDRALTDLESWAPSGAVKADGSALADGTSQAGAQFIPILERSARLLDPGSPDETAVVADGLDRLELALTGRQIAELSVSLTNGDRAPSQALAVETWLSGTLSLILGYRHLPRQDWLERFRGVVERIEISRTQVQITARAS